MPSNVIDTKKQMKSNKKIKVLWIISDHVKWCYGNSEISQNIGRYFDI